MPPWNASALSAEVSTLPRRFAFAARLLLVAGASFVLAAAPSVLAAQPGEREPAFEPLFDGKSLAGWEPHVGFSRARKEEPGGKWWVEDGCLVGAPDDQGKGGFLWVDRVFSDFVLKTDVRLEYPIDSGIFLRCGSGGRSHQVMLDFVSTPHIGAIFVPFQGFVHRCPEGMAALRRADWNRLEIRIEGEPARIRVWLNETLITDFQHTADSTRGAPPSGGIALQAHPPSGAPAPNSAAGSVRFRNLRIKQLKPPNG